MNTEKYKAKLIRVEFFGGPYDGKWLTVADWQTRYILPCGHSLHAYDIDEVYEPSPRTIFRHSQAIPR